MKKNLLLWVAGVLMAMVLLQRVVIVNLQNRAMRDAEVWGAISGSLGGNQ